MRMLYIAERLNYIAVFQKVVFFISFKLNF